MRRIEFACRARSPGVKRRVHIDETMNEDPLKYRVLLIEDDDRLAQLVREYLDGYEFTVTVVRRGDLAVAAVREHQPALVILDLMLPNLDGMEVCRRIRAFTNVPVLILTARLDVYAGSRASRRAPTTT